MNNIDNRMAYLETMSSLKGNLAVTFQMPKVATSLLEEATRLSVKDVDFFEQEVLRQFYINTNRVVEFKFAAYPEDGKYDDDKNFVGLHYHAIVKSKNSAKFKAVAPRKYKAALRKAYGAEFVSIFMPNQPIWVSTIDRTDPEKSYEKYILKHYDPSIRLVTHEDFKAKQAHRSFRQNLTMNT